METVGVHALFEDELDNVLGVLGGVLLEVRDDAVEDRTVAALNLAVAEHSVDEVKLLALAGEGDSVADKSLGAEMKLELIVVVAEEELCDVEVLVLQRKY